MGKQQTIKLFLYSSVSDFPESIVCSTIVFVCVCVSDLQRVFVFKQPNICTIVHRTLFCQFIEILYAIFRTMTNEIATYMYILIFRLIQLWRSISFGNGVTKDTEKMSLLKLMYISQLSSQFCRIHLIQFTFFFSVFIRLQPKINAPKCYFIHLGMNSIFPLSNGIQAEHILFIHYGHDYNKNPQVWIDNRHEENKTHRKTFNPKC